jgi:hypothetical protein
MVLRLNSSNGRFYFFFLLFISSHSLNLPKINWNPWSAISSVHTKARSPKLRPSQTRSIFFINISFKLSIFLSSLSLGSYLSFFYHTFLSFSLCSNLCPYFFLYLLLSFSLFQSFIQLSSYIYICFFQFLSISLYLSPRSYLSLCSYVALYFSLFYQRS